MTRAIGAGVSRLVPLGWALLLVPAAAIAEAPVIDGTRLEVIATGSVTRVPDVVAIDAGVVTQARTAGDAMTQNASRTNAALAALRRAGVAERDLRTSSLSLNPQYQYGENQPPRLTGYQASNQIMVRFRDVARAGAIIDTLVAAGINQIQGPSFELDRPEAALDEARVAAIGTARARADLYARAAGLGVRRIVAIAEGGGIEPPRPMPMMAMREKTADATAIVPGEQKMSVTLNVTFELR